MFLTELTCKGDSFSTRHCGSSCHRETQVDSWTRRKWVARVFWSTLNLKWVAWRPNKQDSFFAWKRTGKFKLLTYKNVRSQTKNTKADSINYLFKLQLHLRCQDTFKNIAQNKNLAHRICVERALYSVIGSIMVFPQIFTAFPRLVSIFYCSDTFYVL